MEVLPACYHQHRHHCAKPGRPHTDLKETVYCNYVLMEWPRRETCSAGRGLLWVTLVPSGSFLQPVAGEPPWCWPRFQVPEPRGGKMALPQRDGQQNKAGSHFAYALTWAPNPRLCTLWLCGR